MAWSFDVMLLFFYSNYGLNYVATAVPKQKLCIDIN